MAKSSRYLTIVGIAILLAVLWYFFIRSDSSGPTELENVALQRSAVPEINFSVLEDEDLKDFKSWSVVPLKPVPTGKSNPFSQ